MILGHVEVEGQTLHTHNDSYLLSTITTISARRPFLAASLLFSTLLAVFMATFFDLMRPMEIAGFALLSVACIAIGFGLGQLQLLSRDLRGSELTTAIWGSYAHVNRVRRQIAAAVTSKERR